MPLQLFNPGKTQLAIRLQIRVRKRVWQASRGVLVTRCASGDYAFRVNYLRAPRGDKNRTFQHWQDRFDDNNPHALPEGDSK